MLFSSFLSIIEEYKPKIGNHLLIGDSVAVSIGALEGYQRKDMNLCKGGLQIESLSTQVQNFKQLPKKVVVVIGANDAHRHVSFSHYKAYFFGLVFNINYLKK